MHSIVARGGSKVIDRPIPVKRGRNGEGEMDMVAAKAVKSVVYLEQR